MRTITVRPIRFGDCEVGATVFAQKHKDFVLEYEIVKVTDSIWDPEQDITKQFPGGHTHDCRSIHAKDPSFGSEWGFMLHNTNPGEPIDQVGWRVPWYVEVVCAGDTDGDGNCPLPGCPKCGKGVPKDDYIERRVIEPEGVVVNLQVFVPNALVDSVSLDERAERAKLVVETIFDESFSNVFEIDNTSARLVSENHVHVFDSDGILIAEDVRTNVADQYVGSTNANTYYFASALDVDVKEAQRQMIHDLADRRAQQEHERSVLSRPKKVRR
jgi:hypothetical protein